MEQNTNNTALLVLDMQAGILSSLTAAPAVCKTIAKAISFARDNKLPVIYSVVGFRKGLPEISANNKIFASLRSRFENADPEEFMKIEPTLAPGETDVVVIKKRYSAFTGSDLEVVLRSQAIQHIVLTGVITGGVILSTAVEAFNKDYQVTILSDACADRDDELHQVLITKLLPRYAGITTVEEWCK